METGSMAQTILSLPETSPRAAGGELVSVVIINYNYGRYLRECIDSVLGQDYEPVEVIVVDDGSTDDSREVIESYRDRLVASFKPNGGMVTAMNHGFALTHGAIVIFVDADDYLLPGAVSAHVEALGEPGVVRSQTYMNVLKGTSASGEKIPDGHAHEGNLQNLILKRGPGAYISSPNSGNAWSRDFLMQVFPLPEEQKTIGSEVFLMDAAPLFGKVVTLNRVKAAYRVHGANMQGNGLAMNLQNIQKVVGHYDIRYARLSQTAKSLGYGDRTTEWRESNWRLLTLEYLHSRLSGKGRKPSFMKHLRSASRVRNPLKRAVVASAVLGIRAMPTRLSLWTAGRVIELRYM
jgi:glycosyltransferase involved in cell wall biosynthesis